MKRLGMQDSDILPTESWAVEEHHAPMLRRYVRRGWPGACPGYQEAHDSIQSGLYAVVSLLIGRACTWSAAAHISPQHRGVRSVDGQ